MLSYADAMYYKMLLEAGVKDEFEPVVNSLLAEEDPLSSVALDLAYAGDDTNKQIAALNEYMSKVDEAGIDMEAVREKLMEYYRRKYEKDPEDIYRIVALMYRVAMNSEYAYNNWPHMWICGDYYELCLEGIIASERFREYFLSFLYDGEIIDPWDEYKKPSIIDRIGTLLRGNRRKERNK